MADQRWCWIKRGQDGNGRSCCGTGQVGWARPRYSWAKSRYGRADQGMIGQKQIYETDINQENIADQGGFQERSGMVGGRGKI